MQSDSSNEKFISAPVPRSQREREEAESASRILKFNGCGAQMQRARDDLFIFKSLAILLAGDKYWREMKQTIHCFFFKYNHVRICSFQPFLYFEILRDR